MKNLKIYAIIGLVFLTLNQILLLNGDDFIQNQKPIDFAHWLLLIGAMFTLSLNNIFSNNNFSNAATMLTFIGAVALIGQGTIDMIWWSYGTDYKELINLINQLKGNPSIWLTFMAIGPSLFYIGLAIHAIKSLRTNTLASIVVVVSTVIIGLSSLVWPERIIIVFGHVFLSIGIFFLIYGKEKLN